MDVGDMTIASLEARKTVVYTAQRALGVEFANWLVQYRSRLMYLLTGMAVSRYLPLLSPLNNTLYQICTMYNLHPDMDHYITKPCILITLEQKKQHYYSLLSLMDMLVVDSVTSQDYVNHKLQQYNVIDPKFSLEFVRIGRVWEYIVRTTDPKEVLRKIVQYEMDLYFPKCCLLLREGDPEWSRDLATYCQQCTTELEFMDGVQGVLRNTVEMRLAGGSLYGDD